MKAKWLVSLLILVLLGGVALATNWMPIPPGAYPVWERGLGVSESGIAVFVFYRPVELVPKKHDFHNSVDLNIPADTPLLVQGFELWDEGDPVPKQCVLENAEGARAVLCFVDWAEIADKWLDYERPFTMSDLMKTTSVQFAYADYYHEVLHPNEMIEVVASGAFEDGRSFFVTTPAIDPLTVRIGE
jgi:hypothetical protein